MQTKLVHEVRAPKSKRELGYIIRAQRISERVLQDVLKYLRTGVTESAVANFVTKSFVKYGAPVLSFAPIVAFGRNTTNIHHTPGRAKLKLGDFVMLDFGTTINHYCSDMTRTYIWGQPSVRQKRIYQMVLDAQLRALRKLGKGERRARVIDRVAREFLARKYKNNFKHGLGHGVGTVIHEWPNFKPKSEDVLPVGAVMTVEPGLYFKNFGGVRIEDMVVIAKTGVENLTLVSKDLNSAILRVHGRQAKFAKKSKKTA